MKENQRRVDSIFFGNSIHRVAVRIGSKSELGKMAGVEKAVISIITRGYGFTLGREILLSVLLASREILGEESYNHLASLVPDICSTDVREKSTLSFPDRKLRSGRERLMI